MTEKIDLSTAKPASEKKRLKGWLHIATENEVFAGCLLKESNPKWLMDESKAIAIIPIDIEYTEGDGL